MDPLPQEAAQPNAQYAQKAPTVTINIVHTTNQQPLAASHASQGGHRTTITCKKMHIYTCQKKIFYVKLTYCDHLNKNVEHLDLRITKSWVQQK